MAEIIPDWQPSRFLYRGYPVWFAHASTANSSTRQQIKIEDLVPDLQAHGLAPLDRYLSIVGRSETLRIAIAGPISWVEQAGKAILPAMPRPESEWLEACRDRSCVLAIGVGNYGADDAPASILRQLAGVRKVLGAIATLVDVTSYVQTRSDRYVLVGHDGVMSEPDEACSVLLDCDYLLDLERAAWASSMLSHPCTRTCAHGRSC